MSASGDSLIEDSVDKICQLLAELGPEMKEKENQEAFKADNIWNLCRAGLLLSGSRQDIKKNLDSFIEALKDNHTLLAEIIESLKFTDTEKWTTDKEQSDSFVLNLWAMAELSDRMSNDKKEWIASILSDAQFSMTPWQTKIIADSAQKLLKSTIANESSGHRLLRELSKTPLFLEKTDNEKIFISAEKKVSQSLE